ncbi:MAG: type I restriction enzyme HsdR N-terminal domain-containing protein [Rhodocyclales bacterium]|nr:type I restriction enzyme HsdR N-terminal domain-containing protein [Rhodocyclales bacterium]
MHQFPPLPFSRMGEADVREEVLAPLVRLLGYRTGTKFDVIREQSLRYPKVFLGRKNPKRDAELRGKADYILEVAGHARWVLEAKAPGVEIDIDSIEQAWTYANHAEVRAVYFALCNGSELKVFATQAAPSVGAFLTVAYEELEKKFPQIENVLGPNAIGRDFPHQLAVVGQPLGPGLRAFARVASGMIVYQKSTLPQPMLSQMQVAIVDGAVERDEQGHLVAYLRTQSPLRSFQELNESLGLDGFEMTSTQTEISLDPANPTEFLYQAVVTLPEGCESLDTATWKKVKLPYTMQFEVISRAIGSLTDQTFRGRFISEMRILNNALPPVVTEGEFFVRLA